MALILLREGANVDTETLKNMEFENSAGESHAEGCITPLQDVTSSLVGEEIEIIINKIEFINIILEFNPNVLKRNKAGKTPLQVLNQSIKEIINTYLDITVKVNKYATKNKLKNISEIILAGLVEL